MLYQQIDEGAYLCGQVMSVRIARDDGVLSCQKVIEYRAQAARSQLFGHEESGRQVNALTMGRGETQLECAVAAQISRHCYRLLAVGASKVPFAAPNCVGVP